MLLIIVAVQMGCSNDSGTSTGGSGVREQIDKIDEVILKRDPYGENAFRYPANGFPADSFPLLDSNFVQTMVTVYHDTLTRKIIRIDFSLGKDRLSPGTRSHFFYYDENSELMKIQVLTYDTDPQYAASYYFQKHTLICQREKHVAINDLESYVLKADTIYRKVHNVLAEKGVVD